MSWIPSTFEEACRRNAGRKKLHMRKRKVRANRIQRLLSVLDIAPQLTFTAYGWLDMFSESMAVSKATASRDCAFVRRMNLQFLRLFGRDFDPTKDEIVWSWDWASYGFATTESWKQGTPKAWANSHSILEHNAHMDEKTGAGAEKRIRIRFAIHRNPLPAHETANVCALRAVSVRTAALAFLHARLLQSPALCLE